MRWLCLLVILVCACRSFSRVTTPQDVPPVVEAMSPLTVVRGSGCATLTGSGFSRLTRARAGSLDARLEVQSDTSARLCPNAGVALGEVAIELGQSDALTTIAQRLAITETDLLLDEPRSKVAPGANIVFGGLGFDVAHADNHTILFTGGVAGIVRAVTRDSLTVEVPEGAISGEVAMSLTTVDPPAPSAKVTLTILGPFNIASVIPARAAGAYAGEALRVVLDTPLAETASDDLLLSLDGDVLPAPTPADATSFTLFLPEGLLPSEDQTHELCVQGSLATACAEVPVLGAGHSNLGRSPQCRSFDLSLDAHNFRWPFPIGNINSSGLVALPSRAYILDERMDLLFGVDTNSGETVETYPMLPDAFHDALIVHSGCTTLVCGSRPGPGYAAAVDRAGRLLYFTRFDNGDRVALDIGDFSVEPFVIDRSRFGVFLTPQTGATQVLIVDVANPPQDLTAAVSLGGRLNVHTAVVFHART